MYSIFGWSIFLAVFVFWHFVRFSQPIVVRNLCSPKISSQMSLITESSLSSIDMNIKPFSDNNFFAMSNLS